MSSDYCIVIQVAVNGQRTRIAMDISSAKEFHERLTEFCEYYSSLGLPVCFMHIFIVLCFFYIPIDQILLMSVAYMTNKC